MTDDDITARLRAATIGELERHPIDLVESDPAWPARFETEAERIRAALGDIALELHHVGSTAVPDLPAKPVIDIVLIVADAADEVSYLGPLEGIGYELRIREPDWYQHRVLRPRGSREVNLHVFGPGCREVERMVRFRDHLRTDTGDRQRYAETKRLLAQRDWPTVQHYADAKTDVIAAILERAGRTD